MTPPRPYTTRLQAGLGLIEETHALLDLWEPGMTVPRLTEQARLSGRFASKSARRLRNVVVECFAPRYLTGPDDAVLALKTLARTLPRRDLSQIFLLHTARANAILADFIRQVYWARYAGGYEILTRADAVAFIQDSLAAGRMEKIWADATIRRVAGYLASCCADFGLLEPGSRLKRKIIPVHPSPALVVYLAYDLHFAGLGDNTLLQADDWQLFGLHPHEVLAELKREQRRAPFMVQSAGDLVRITWKYDEREAVSRVLVES